MKLNYKQLLISSNVIVIKYNLKKHSKHLSGEHIIHYLRCFHGLDYIFIVNLNNYRIYLLIIICFITLFHLVK